jgi:hypothetical protein
LLAAAIAFVGLRVYQLWLEGSWDLPKPGKGKDSSIVGESKKESPRPQLVSTRDIVDKNLFDPERGAGRVSQAEASSGAVQRVRSMVLLGTAILGSSRYAILREPTDSRAPAAKGQTVPSGVLRLKVGDTVEGFRLSEVHEKRVVLTKGSSRVELALDFSRKIEEPGPKPPAGAPVRPGVQPRVTGPQPGPPVAR